MRNLQNTLERLRTLAGELPENQQNILNDALLEVERHLNELSQRPTSISYDVSKTIQQCIALSARDDSFEEENQTRMEELKSFHDRALEQEKALSEEYGEIITRHLADHKSEAEFLKESMDIQSKIESNRKSLEMEKSA